ncbi:hypothetical protein TrVGV298_010480 [Trichoderma virens]|nr:hypothetical protein TrVGV298_010480 [Trichoderma virens]
MKSRWSTRLTEESIASCLATWELEITWKFGDAKTGMSIDAVVAVVADYFAGLIINWRRSEVKELLGYKVRLPMGATRDLTATLPWPDGRVSTEFAWASSIVQEEMLDDFYNRVILSGRGSQARGEAFAGRPFLRATTEYQQQQATTRSRSRSRSSAIFNTSNRKTL